MVGPVQRPALGIAVLMARYAMELERLAVEEKALFGVDGDGADAERLLDPVEQPPLRVANLGQDAIEIGVGQPVPAVRIGDAQPRLVKIGRATSESSPMRNSYAVFCLKKKNSEQPPSQSDATLELASHS